MALATAVVEFVVAFAVAAPVGVVTKRLLRRLEVMA